MTLTVHQHGNTVECPGCTGDPTEHPTPPDGPAPGLAVDDLQSVAKILADLQYVVGSTLADAVDEQAALATGFVDDDLVTLAETLHGIRQLKGTLVIVERDAEAALAACMQRNQDTAGPYTLTRRFTQPKEVWEDRLVTGALAQRLATTGDGEHDPELADTLERAFGDLLDCAAPRWRKGALRDHDIDPDRYCAREGQGRHTVQVDKADLDVDETRL